MGNKVLVEETGIISEATAFDERGEPTAWKPVKRVFVATWEDGARVEMVEALTVNLAQIVARVKAKQVVKPLIAIAKTMEVVEVE